MGLHSTAPDPVNDGVVAGVGFGEEGRPDRVQGRDDGLAVKDPDEVYDEIRCPRHEPQRDSHQRDLNVEKKETPLL